ncbi:VOC family protein [Thiogranum longum]
MTEFVRLHHVSVLISNVDEALRFYVDVLGMSADPSRPDLGFPGAWLQVGSQQIHLLELANPDPAEGRPLHVGRDRHMAIQLRGLDALEQRLERAGVVFTRSRSGRKAIFCRDPDGNGIELIEQG